MRRPRSSASRRRFTIRTQGLSEIQEARRSFARAGLDEARRESAQRASVATKARRSLIQRPQLSTADRPTRASVVQRTTLLQRSSSTPTFVRRASRTGALGAAAPDAVDDASSSKASAQTYEPTPMPAALRDKYKRPTTILPTPTGGEPPRRRNSLLQHV